MTLHGTGLECHVGPVGVGLAVIELLDAVGADEVGSLVGVFGYPGDVILCIQRLGNMGHLVGCQLHIIANLADTLGRLLGGDEHDAVTCLRTVDGGRSGILEDFHALDVIRVEVCDRLRTETVHDIERIGGAVG